MIPVLEEALEEAGITVVVSGCVVTHGIRSAGALVGLAAAKAFAWAHGFL